MNKPCSLCGSKEVTQQLNLTNQPLSNRFLESADVNIPSVDISIGICRRCQTIQLVSLPNVDDVRPIYPWLTYNEPEQHLDDVVSRLLQCKDIDSSKLVVGVTYKDQSTLERINALSGARTYCLKYPQLSESSGLESIQLLLSQDIESVINSNDLKSLAKPDVIVMRHIVEHAFDTRALLKNISRLLHEDGILIIEFPDSRTIFEKKNLAFLWEEHISYFFYEDTPQIASHNHLKVLQNLRYPYPFEDSVVAFLKKAPEEAPKTAYSKTKDEYLTSLQVQFEAKKLVWQRRLASLKDSGKNIAVFGAGHLSIKFINFFELGRYIDVVLDDNPHKAGLYIPKSGTQIMRSTGFSAKEFPVCISTLSPESQEKVLATNDYMRSGVTIINAFEATMHENLEPTGE